MITKQQYTKQVKEISQNYPTTNWDNYEDRWLYHKEAIKWLKELNPETILEVGGLGIKIREDSKTLDNGKWKIDHNVDYLQDVADLNFPDFDCIVALRVLHHTDYPKVIKGLLKKCKYLIVAIPQELEVDGWTEKKTFKDTSIYLWK